MTLPPQTREHPSMLPPIRWRGWPGILIGIVGILLIGLLLFVTIQPIKVLPRIRMAPGFALQDQQGERLTSEDLRGQFVLYNFTHTACHAPDCVQYDQVMRQVQERLPEPGEGEVPISLVSIAFDADRATAAQLQAYANSLGADTTNWHFVTGSEDHLKNVIGAGFEVYYEQTDEDIYAFSPTMILVDGWGIVRAIYNTRTSPPNADHIVRHFNVLAEEVQNSTGVARVGYEAAHLFLCYAS